MVRSATHVDDVFDVLDFTQVQVAVQHNDRIVSAVGFLAYDIISGIDEVNIVSFATSHFVSTATTVQNVVAIVTDQDVIVFTTDAILDVVFGLVCIVASKDRHIVAVPIDAGELTSTQVKDRACR